VLLLVPTLTFTQSSIAAPSGRTLEFAAAEMAREIARLSATEFGCSVQPVNAAGEVRQVRFMVTTQPAAAALRRVIRRRFDRRGLSQYFVVTIVAQRYSQARIYRVGRELHRLIPNGGVPGPATTLITLEQTQELRHRCPGYVVLLPQGAAPDVIARAAAAVARFGPDRVRLKSYGPGDVVPT